MATILHWIHGKRPHPLEVAIVNGSAAIAALIITVDGYQYGYAVRHLLLLALLSYDIVGGVIANVTRPTNDYYVRRPRASYLFLLIHFVHPLLFVLFLGMAWPTAVYLYVAAVVCGALIVTLRGNSRQLPLALALLTLTLLLYSILFLPPPPIEPLGALYLIKLIGSFAPDYYGAAG